MKDLVAELEDTVRIHREIARTSLITNSWHGKFTRESQGYLAGLGRHLINLIIRHITEPSKREEIVKLARDVGHDFGEVLAEQGLPLTGCVEAFILHRNAIMNVVTHLMRKGEAFTGRIVEALPLIDRVLDEALLSLVAVHQQYEDMFKEEPEKEEVAG